MKKQLRRIAAIFLAAAILVSSMLSGMTVIAADGDAISPTPGGKVLLADQIGELNADVTARLVEDSTSPTGYAITGGFDVPGSGGDDLIDPTLSSDAFSIEIWVNPADLNSGNGFLSKGNDWQVSLKTSSKGLEFFINDGAYRTLYAPLDTLTANAWNHIIVTSALTDAGAVLCVYVNGELAATTTYPECTSINDRAEVLAFGQGNASLRGKFAATGVYNTVLAANDVAARYAANAATPTEESCILWYDAGEYILEAGEITFPVELSANWQASISGFSGHSYGSKYSQNQYLYADYMGWQPTFSYDPAPNTTSAVTFNVPEGATALTGKVAMSDGCVTSNAQNLNNYVWFSTNDGTTETPAAAIGPFLRYTTMGQNFNTAYANATAEQQVEMADRAHEFTVAIPEGAKTLTINVSNNSNSTWQYTTFFDTMFVNDVTVDADVAATDAQIAKLADAHGELAAFVSNGYTAEDTDVVAAKAAYNALTDEQKALVNGAYALTRMKSYEEVLEEVKASIFYPNENPRIDGNRYDYPNLYNYWVRTATGDEWDATVDAIRDEMLYQYVERGLNVGITGASAGNRFHSWQTNYYYLQMGDAVGGETALTTPFPRTAFTLLRNFYTINYSGGGEVGNDNNPNTGNDMLPLGNPFDFDGKTYQVCWNNTGIIENGATSTNNLYPGSGVAAAGNVFRQAYAIYSQTGKWDGLTLGIPATDAVQNGGTVAQEFIGPDGAAYLVANAEMLTEGAAAYITGNVAAIVAAYEGDFFAAAGEYENFVNGVLTFENLMVTEDGVVEVEKIDLSIDITDAVALLDEADGKYDITWNANVLLGENTLDYINENVKFKAYGVVYGTGENAVDEAAESGLESSNAKIMNFDKGDNIDVYTIFGFRLKNVVEGKARAAKFFITYEMNGIEHTIYSETAPMTAETIA